MRIYVNYDCDDHNRIRGVQTLSYYLDKGKTEADIDKVVEERNKECGWELFRTFEVSDEMEAVFRFMLGEKEYKRLADITALYEKLKDIKDDVDSMRDETYQMREYLESTIKNVEKLVPEEDR